MNADVFTMKVDGSDVRRVTDFKAMSWAPFYHPSGQYVIFTANKLGFENFELFIVDAQGEREPVRVTFTDGFDGLPVFAPGGRQLSWTSGRTADGKSQIFLTDWNHPAALKALEEAPLRQKSAAELEAAAEKKKRAEMEYAQAQSALAPLPCRRDPRLPEGGAELTAEIRADDLEHIVKWMADPKREGRATGSPGADAAARFAASYFDAIGLKPAGEDFLLPFEFDAGVKVLPEKNRLVLRRSGSRSRRLRWTRIIVRSPSATPEKRKARWCSPDTDSVFRKTVKVRATTATTEWM
jgi:hypothetical protein